MKQNEKKMAGFCNYMFNYHWIFKSKSRSCNRLREQFFTNVSLTKSKRGNKQRILKKIVKVRVAYDFVITQPVASGETMTLTIPNQLKLINYGGFPLMDSQGNTIANATIDQVTGTITLTFTDYVNTHTDLSGSLFYNATFNSKKYSNRSSKSNRISGKKYYSNSNSIY